MHFIKIRKTLLSSKPRNTTVWVNGTFHGGTSLWEPNRRQMISSKRPFRDKSCNATTSKNRLTCNSTGTKEVITKVKNDLLKHSFGDDFSILRIYSILKIIV
jgi:hypothetical protein